MRDGTTLGNRFIPSKLRDAVEKLHRIALIVGCERTSEDIDTRARKEHQVIMDIHEAVRTLEQKCGLSQSERAERAARSVAHLQD